MERLIAEAVAAERERCAQLAESVRATYADTQPPGVDVGDGHYWHPFAALLREAGDRDGQRRDTTA